MKKTVLLITMMALVCVTMKAQSTFNVSGNVVEKESGEAVVAATIQLLSMPDSSFVEGTVEVVWATISVLECRRRRSLRGNQLRRSAYGWSYTYYRQQETPWRTGIPLPHISTAGIFTSTSTAAVSMPSSSSMSISPTHTCPSSLTKKMGCSSS